MIRSAVQLCCVGDLIVHVGISSVCSAYSAWILHWQTSGTVRIGRPSKSLFQQDLAWALPTTSNTAVAGRIR
jgi:hypothetical protein